MARTIVITGGTRGIGSALARERLRRGDAVVAVARDAALGRRFVEEGGDRAGFIAADLSTVAGTREVAAELADRHPVIDALVLGAHSMRPGRHVTAEGLEATFALYYLSRHVLLHALAEPLTRADRAVTINLSGAGMTAGRIHWDDLQLTRGYSATKANLQAGRANDLLGVAFAEEHPGISTVAYNPGFVDTRPYTGMARPYRALAELAAAVAAAAPERAATALSALIDEPPPGPFAARKRRGSGNRPIDTTGPTYDPGTARRLDAATRDLLAGLDAVSR
ncbi:SDR family NAD(P)-dependent oxidoreductase [Pseudonocardia humida]|uniref:SDR family NAD(P)-dependent oxidoreductase n=1 Tax=Pseudonocardia humida TaxID=2800819 RepID=A0ABT1A5N5_9PSEU|nr:SDR family NAD(P)-dependent oxidoreductase [Pseudonocardia humida]MCO1658337.1 SDR family NAD(P)-dependent oxidoreductase [Pseudonocardia humida]